VKHLAAYLLASLSGSEPSAATVKKILSAVGVEADAERLEKMIGELSGKDLQAVRATVG
jgi:large subunit ribosomal protein LP2